MTTSSKENIFRITGHLCGDFTGHWWIPRKKASEVELWCFDLRPNKRLSKQSWGWWFETPSCSLWRHCNEIAARYRQTFYYCLIAIILVIINSQINYKNIHNLPIIIVPAEGLAPPGSGVSAGIVMNCEVLVTSSNVLCVWACNAQIIICVKIWGLWLWKHASKGWISICIPQNSVGM